MPRRTLIMLAAAVILTIASSPAAAGGYVGLEVSNNGVSLGFGASTWGIWGTSWSSGNASIGFSATLTGYGDWIHVNGLGRVWRPWVAAGWQPYTHGRWMWTSLGWTWVAYEPWGWVPHHYGNWAYSTVGWVWTPGYAYHPGNVVWVSTGVHVGWYPCAPRGWSHSHRGYHRGWHDGYANGHANGYTRGYEDGWRDARYATWVPRSQVTAENISHHTVRHETATRAVARSAVTVMDVAPTRNQVESFSGRPVPEARIVEHNATIDGHHVRMVRPEGQERTVQRHGAATVDRALTPEARRRVVSVQGTQVQRQNTVTAKITETKQPTARRSETRRTVGDERRETTSRSATRTPDPVSKSSVPSRRTASGFEPRSQYQSAPVSAGSHRSNTRTTSTSQSTKQPERPQISTGRTRSAPQADPSQRVGSGNQRYRGARDEPETTTSSVNERRTRPERIEPAEKKQSKRTRSRS